MNLGILYIIFGLLGAATSIPGWKEETKWKTSSKSGRNEHARKGPHLLPGLPTNVSVTTGGLVTLPCRLANLKGRSVSWIRRGDLMVLTTDRIVFTTDTRFKVVALRTGMVWTWDLEIHDVSANDAGLYECQVNTRPKISHQLLLNVHQGSTVISGPPEIYLETGSMLILTCAITAPPLPSGPVAWMHGDRVLDVKIHRGEVTLYETQDGPQLTSVLEISNVSSSDTGNYTCRPQGLPVAMVSVYVLQDEEPRAMHHDGASALEGHWIIVFLLLVVSVLILR